MHLPACLRPRHGTDLGGARRSALCALLAAALSAALLPACIATADDPAAPEPGGTGGDPGQPTGAGVCLLNSCSSDAECLGCSDDRSRCLVEENRCVGCDPNTGTGCGTGLTCSSWGICAPDGQTCPTDGLGNPTFTCTQNSDCLACSPMNQVCGPDGVCTACTPTNTKHCTLADVCVGGQCTSKCPASCSADADCVYCGGPGNEAHACNAGQCAQCSASYPCAEGKQCKSGTCVPVCGMVGSAPGTCGGDEDCAFCGDGSQDWACKKHPNDTQGSCVPAATGCSDIGPGFGMLPEPYDQVTQTCSHDAGCAGISADYNVGALVRDLLGTDRIDLGFADVEIQDAYVAYGMHKCAAFDLIGDVSCGVCVPCVRDADCAPIGIDPLLGQMFAQDPLAAIAGSLLIDLLFGSSASHQLHLFCQPVAAGYGACVPCGNPLAPCAG